MKGLAEALVDAPKTGQAEREESSTSSYQVNNVLPAVLISVSIWWGLFFIADAIRGMKPTIQLHEHPTKVEVIREVNQLDGYLPGVRK